GRRKIAEVVQRFDVVTVAQVLPARWRADHPIGHTRIGEATDDLRAEIMRPGIARTIHLGRCTAAASELKLDNRLHFDLLTVAASQRKLRETTLGALLFKKVRSRCYI